MGRLNTNKVDIQPVCVSTSIYFLDLIKLQEHIREEANKRVGISKRLLNENKF